MHIFLDESGDLGFDLELHNTSKFFTITLLACEDNHSLHTIKIAVERTIKNKIFPKIKNNNRAYHELKGTDSNHSTKLYFLKHANKANTWCIYTMILDKKSIFRKLPQPINTHKIYNAIANHLLQQVNFSHAKTINLFIDKSKNRAGMDELNTLLEASLSTILPNNILLNIKHICSHKSYGVQAVDIFCWGIFRRYERNDDEWYKEVSKKIVYEQRFTI